MSAVFALLAGWGVHRVLVPRADAAARLTGAVVWGVVSLAGWMAVLDVLGISWRAGLLAIPALAGLGLVGFGRTVPGERADSEEGPLDRFGVAAGFAVACRALLVAAVPGFGWDFRYIWGLKGKVFAAAGTHDFAWLAWRPFAFSHPDYPPLWSDLLAAGVCLGGTVSRTAAVWGALFVVGLGAACWRLARPAGRGAAAVAAAAGAWAPVLMEPSIGSSGSAEPLAALLLSVAVAELFAAGAGKVAVSWTGLAALAALTLTKHEGTVMAFCLAAAAGGRVAPRLRGRLWAGVLVPASAWQLAVWAAHIPRRAAVLDPARMAARATDLPGAVLAAMNPVLALEVAVLLLVLISPAVARPLRLALAVWLALVAASYLVIVDAGDLAWLVRTSLERVLAIPLPLSLALLVGCEGHSPQPKVTPR